MATEDEQVVQRRFELLARGHHGRDLCDPEVLIANWAESPIPGPYVGHEGLEQWWTDFAEVIEGVRLAVREGKILSAIGYASPGRAKKAAGLEPPRRYPSRP